MIGVGTLEVEVPRRGRGQEGRQVFQPVLVLALEEMDLSPGGMAGRKVERGEVIPLGFRFGAQRDRESELAENFRYLLDYQRDGMLGAAPLPARRHREVELPLGHARGFELSASLLESRLEFRFHGVDQ